MADRYVVVRLAATGGMGEIYVAVHAALGTPVALKVMREALAGPTHAERFLREAQAAARIKSEHVAHVYDFGLLTSGAPFMILELLDGIDLDRLLAEQGRLPPERAVDYALQACEGLAAAHAAGIVHRDIKPSNLFLTARADGSALLKVLDFGIAKFESDPTETPGGPLGSPYYTSPEQMRGADVDCRTDVWSLGVTLYECLTGARPFEGSTAGAIYMAIGRDPPRPVEAADLPPGLVALVMRCLEKDPALRPQSVGELACALAPFAAPEAAVHAERASRTLLAQAPPSAPRMRVHSNPDDATVPANGPPTPPASSRRTSRSGPRRAAWATAAAAAVGLACVAAVRPGHQTFSTADSRAALQFAARTPFSKGVGLPERSPSPTSAASVTSGASATGKGAGRASASHARPPSLPGAQEPHTTDGTEDRN